jgi:hypothetical protein
MFTAGKKANKEISKIFLSTSSCSGLDDSSNLKKGLACFSETSVHLEQSTWRYISTDRNLSNYCYNSLKSSITGGQPFLRDPTEYMTPSNHLRLKHPVSETFLFSSYLDFRATDEVQKPSDSKFTGSANCITKLIKGNLVVNKSFGSLKTSVTVSCKYRGKLGNAVQSCRRPLTCQNNISVVSLSSNPLSFRFLNWLI